MSRAHPVLVSPDTAPIHRAERPSVGSSNPMTLVFQASLWVYQHVFSPVDGPTCNFYPVCSVYGMQAVTRHGWLLGGAMALERSMRYHGATGVYPIVVVDGVRRYWDPLDDNDFWLPEPGCRHRPMHLRPGVILGPADTRALGPAAAATKPAHGQPCDTAP